MDFILKWIIEKKGATMLDSLFAKISGYKVYGLAIIGILAGLVGHFWGPVDVGAIQIPSFTWPEFWKLVWECGLLIAGRSTAEKFLASLKK